MINDTPQGTVAPLAGAWIETKDCADHLEDEDVAPLAGAWIETDKVYSSKVFTLSRPSRARGLKRLAANSAAIRREVAPLAGAWIETCASRHRQPSSRVAPLAGAWIETIHAPGAMAPGEVAPLAGAWIETSRSSKAVKESRRAPRGRVD